MAAIPRPPTIQLSVSPSDPRGPPPSSWKVVSSGAIVRPRASWNAAPRQISRPPRVTMNDGIPTYATRKPCMPPISAPTATPARTTMIHRNVRSKPGPRMAGIHSVWRRPMTITTKTRIDPIDRSMLRDTMIRTMPVVMIATAADWTDRFHRFRGVRNRPSDKMLKATHRMIEGRGQAQQAGVHLEAGEHGSSRPFRWGAAGDRHLDRRLSHHQASCEGRWYGNALRRGGAASAGRFSYGISDGLRATGDGRRRDVLAELLDGEPVGVEDDLEVVLRDRHRREQDRGAVDAADRLGRRRHRSPW